MRFQAGPRKQKAGALAPLKVDSAYHNRVLKAATDRSDVLEEEMVRLLIPVFEKAGRVAAQNFTARVTDHLTAAGASIGPGKTMIALYPRPEEQAALAEDGGEAPDSIHVTLCFLGDIDEDTARAAAAAMADVASQHPPLEGEAGGVGAFSDNGNGVPAIVLPDVPGLTELRQAVVGKLADAGIDYYRNHGYQPHATIAYRGEGESHPPSMDSLGTPLHLDTLHVVQGDNRVASHPLTGKSALTAAGDPFLEALAEAMTRDIDEHDGFEDWYRRYGRAPGVVFEGGAAIPSFWDSIRYSAYRDGGLDAMLEHDRRFDLHEQIRQVAKEHAPDGGYGDTWWNEEEKTVYWVSADWSTDEEIAEGVDAFLDLDGVEQVEDCAECGAPSGDEWERVYDHRPIDRWFTPLTAAAPKPNDDFCLPAEVRGITDPIRAAAVETVMRSSLEGVGVAFDPVNPLAEKVLSQSGSQVVGISQTVQLDVMKTIRASYQQGLSIPDTAKAIRAAMTEAAPARARTIARTELSGAVHGASLASTLIVAQATGTAYRKTWRTAPGAQYPRHEDYDGLDGQQVALDEDFDVGGASLEYPGDPGGEADETINCRCSMTYEEAGGGEVEASAAPVWSGRPCGCATRSTVDPRVELELVMLHLADDGPARWTSPSPSEILPTNCMGLPAPPPGERSPLERAAGPEAPQGPTADEADAAAAANALVGAASRAEPMTSAALQQVAQGVGGEMVGLSHAVKTSASLERKIGADLAEARLLDGSASIADMSGSINDVLRYTMQFGADGYTEGVRAAIKRLDAEGYRTVKVKNYWSGEDYKGINAVFESPDGQRFELQFHTDQSFATKDGPLHDLYEQYRVSTDPAERLHLWAEMKALTDGMTTPAGVMSIGKTVTHAAPS